MTVDIMDACRDADSKNPNSKGNCMFYMKNTLNGPGMLQGPLSKDSAPLTGLICLFSGEINFKQLESFSMRDWDASLYYASINVRLDWVKVQIWIPSKMGKQFQTSVSWYYNTWHVYAMHVWSIHAALSIDRGVSVLLLSIPPSLVKGPMIRNCFLKEKIINFWHMEKNNSNAELHRALKDKFSCIWHPQYTTESCNISLDFIWMLNLHWERYLFWMGWYKNLFLRQKTWEKGVCSHCMDCFYYISLIKKKSLDYRH